MMSPREEQRRPSSEKQPPLKQLRAGTGATAASSRRKWSDWSECSEECLRTRHRLNCDDLLASSRNLSAAPANSASKQVASSPPPPPPPLNELAGDQRKPVRRSNNIPLPTRDQYDDEHDDYADEGDEDDESDSCANVETSKTFEEQLCLGGLCKLSANEVQTLRQRTASGHIKPPGRGSHAKVTQVQNGYDSATNEPPPPPPPLQHHFHQDVGQASLRPPKQLPGGAAPLSLSNSNSIHSNQRHEAVDISSAPSVHHQANFILGHQWQQQQQQPPPPPPPPTPTTRQIELGHNASMWPASTQRQPTSQMSATTLSHQHLIQLTLLMGVLMSLVLFVALLLWRLRLFKPKASRPKSPSYNWMLARQQKRAKHSTTPASCCHHPPSNPICCSPSAAKLSAASATTTSTASELVHLHDQEAHQNLLACQQVLAGPAALHKQQMCYLWGQANGGQAKSSFVASLGHLVQQFGVSKSQMVDYNNPLAGQSARVNPPHSKQYFVDLNGRHFIANNSKQKLATNTNRSTGSSSNSTGSTGPAGKPGQRALTHQPMQTSNKTYNSLELLYSEPTSVVRLHAGYQQHQTTSREPDYDYDTLPEGFPPASQLSQMPSRPRERAQATTTATTATSSNKQPPNVPTKRRRNKQEGTQEEEEEDTHGTSHSTGRRQSRSSPKSQDASSSDSQDQSRSSSASVQSATAQLLSNESGAGSGSFEETPEIVDEQAPLERREDATSSSTSASTQNTPVLMSRQFHLRHHQQPVRSQPNSPLHFGPAGAANLRRGQFKFSAAGLRTAHPTTGRPSDTEPAQQHLYEEIGPE